MSERTRRFLSDLPSNWHYVAVHVVAVVALFAYPPSWQGVALAAGVYVAGIFGVTAGYHRYFSHRTFKTSRGFQLVLAWLAQSTTQKGVLWWASHHRRHHRCSDQEGDPHSPLRDGFLWAHTGWVLAEEEDYTDVDLVRDLARYPELVWLNEHYLVPPMVWLALCGLVGGMWGMAWGAAIPTVLMWHGTYTINSLSHTWGWRVYDTTDTSRNNPLLAVLTLGEGWHNNHHHYMSSCRQGFLWWEFDPTFYVLWTLSKLGVVWDVKAPPQEVVDARWPLLAPDRPAIRDAVARAYAMAEEADRMAAQASARAHEAVASAQGVIDRARTMAEELQQAAHDAGEEARAYLVAASEAAHAAAEEAAEAAREAAQHAADAAMEARERVAKLRPDPRGRRWISQHAMAEAVRRASRRAEQAARAAEEAAQAAADAVGGLGLPA